LNNQTSNKNSSNNSDRVLGGSKKSLGSKRGKFKSKLNTTTFQDQLSSTEATLNPDSTIDPLKPKKGNLKSPVTVLPEVKTHKRKSKMNDRRSLSRSPNMQYELSPDVADKVNKLYDII
jgi:hypothetical protein